MKHLMVGLTIVLSAFLASCSGEQGEKSQVGNSQKMEQSNQAGATEKGPETIVVDLCRQDPENAELWRKTGVNLFTDPSVIPKRKVGEIPACQALTVEVLEKKTVDGIEFFKIKWKNTVGWQTRRLLTSAGAR